MSDSARRAPDGATAPRAQARDVAPLELADQLASLGFHLVDDDRAALLTERDRLVRLLRGVPARAARPEAPLLVVVGGGSGAGKSTTVNTLAGRRVTDVGVVRPTTRVPTLVCHPGERGRFEDDRVLPGLTRISEDAAGTPSGRQLRLTTSAQLPSGIALLDTPDIDTVEVANHALADEALDAADVWLWLVTARTYADEVGAAYLRRARDRQALVVIVITQVRDEERAEVLADVPRRLRAEGVDPARIVDIAHQPVEDAQLPRSTVAPLDDLLTDLAPAERRAEVRRSAIEGLRAAVPDELAGLRRAVERELETASRLRATVDARFDRVPDELREELEAGLSLRAEVLERWRGLVGGNAALQKVQSAAEQVGSVVRTRLGRRTTDPAEQMQVEVAGELTRIVTRLLEHAHDRARRDLEADRVSRDLLDDHPAIRDHGEDRPTRVRRAIADWEDEVARLVEEVGAPRRDRARRWTNAVNALATSAILVLFALSGGLTTGEVGIAAAAAATSHWLLTKLLGERNVQRLLEEIRDDLQERIGELLAEERAPFHAALDAATPPRPAVTALRTAARSER